MLKAIERDFFRSAIRLSDIKAGMPQGVNPDVQVLRIGKFNHPKYGEFEITTALLAELKANFDNNVRGVDIAIDYFHKSDEAAAGWIKELFLSEDGDALWAKVDWTAEATKKLSDREIRYFSPDFAFQWTDSESGVAYNNVLFGGGLTNRPFVKDMAAIVAAEKEEEMTITELEKKVLKLAEDGADLASKHADLQKAHSDLLDKHGALQKKLEEMGPPAPAPAADDSDDDGDDDSEPKDLESAKKQLADMKAKLAEYAESAKKAAADKQLAEKKTKFNVMLSEGKACAAQEKSFMSGDMEEFVKLSQPLNLDGKGSTKDGGDGGTDREDRVMKLAEEKCKADPKLKMHDAISLANKEVK